MDLSILGLYNMYYRDCYLSINMDNIAQNIVSLSKNSDIIAIVKANAYGMGAIEIAKLAIENKAIYLAVSSLDEAIQLRKANITHPIMILGYVSKDQYDIIRNYDLTLITTSLEWLEKTYPFLYDIKIHIKVNTGLNRLGLKSLQEVRQALDLLKKAKVEGIFSHYACSDERNHQLNIEQVNRFNYILRNIKHDFKYIHMSNTDASYKLDNNNCSRIGIGLYGYSNTRNDLIPSISLYSTIIKSTIVNKKESISYGAKYTCEKDEHINVVCIGYADGIARRHSGFNVYIEGEYAPIVGNVCMDLLMVKTKKAYPLGTKVEFFGPHIKLEDFAARIGEIPYTILLAINDRVTRKYYKNNRIVKEINNRFGDNYE